DVGEGGGDDDAEAVIAERPRGVLAARSAGEVLAGNENLRALVAGIVENEVGVLVARRGATPVEEEEFAVAGALDALEELLGNDLVGIDVGAVEGGGQCCEGLEGFHASFPQG